MVDGRCAGVPGFVSNLTKGVDIVSNTERVMCPYCNQPAVLMSGEQVYPHRPDLHKKWVYACGPCKARVGCHGNSKQPLGRLANAELRKAKIAAHGAFDQLWRSHGMSRADSYKWLAERLNVPVEEAHIGLFDVETCHQVVELCRAAPKGNVNRKRHRKR